MDWYKKFPGRYRRKTAGCSLLDHGSYNVLLDEYFLIQGPLPPDYESLYRICNATKKAEKESVKRIADKHFPMNGDGTRHNKTADELIGDYGTRCDTNRAIAQAREDARRVARLAHEPSTNRAPIDREIDKRKSAGAHFCQQYLDNGNKCGEPTELRLGNQWLCRPHHPYLKG